MEERKMKKIVGIIAAHEHDIDDDKYIIVYTLQPPENLKICTPPRLQRFYRDLPFSPDDIEFLPETAEITEEDIELQMDALRSAGAPFANDPKKLREEAIEVLKMKRITRKEAERMLRDAEEKYKKAFEEFKKTHEQVMIAPPKEYEGKVEPFTVWVKKEAE